MPEAGKSSQRRWCSDMKRSGSVSKKMAPASSPNSARRAARASFCLASFSVATTWLCHRQFFCLCAKDSRRRAALLSALGGAVQQQCVTQNVNWTLWRTWRMPANKKWKFKRHERGGGQKRKNIRECVYMYTYMCVCVYTIACPQTC